MDRNELITVKSAASLLGYVRRVARWYVTPSGLLLAGSLALLTLGFLGVGPSRLFQVLAVVALAVFLPYRFSRQQGLGARRSEAIEGTVSHLQGKVSHLQGKVQRQQNKSQRRYERLVSTADVQAEASARSEHEFYRRLAGQAGRLSVVSESVAANSDAAAGMQTANQVVEELSLRLVGMASEIESLEARLTSAVAATESRFGEEDARLGDLEAQSAAFVELQADFAQSTAALQSERAAVMAQVQDDVRSLTESGDAANSESVPRSEFADRTETEKLVSTEISRLRSDMAMWSVATRPDRDQFNHLALIVSPERCGTTWTFDIVRSFPGASQMASRYIYELLDIRGNRYPHHLLDIDRAGEPIEVRDGTAGWIPSLREERVDSLARDLIAVEKVHPSAFDFDETALSAGLRRVEKALGRVTLIFLIRDPLDAFRSFRSYQDRAGWHADVEPSEVATLYAESMATMLRLIELHGPSLVVSYEDLVRDPVGQFVALGLEMGLKLEADGVSSLLTAADGWRDEATSSAYFGGSTGDVAPQPTPLQLVLGRGLGNKSEQDELRRARELYGELWKLRLTTE